MHTDSRARALHREYRRKEAAPWCVSAGWSRQWWSLRSGRFLSPRRSRCSRGRHAGLTMTRRRSRPTPISRRTFLAGAAATAVTLAGCSRDTTVRIPNDRIAAAEAARPHTGRTVAVELTPGHAQLDLGGTRAATFAYGDVLPG